MAGKPAEALAYDELTTPGLMKIYIVLSLKLILKPAIYIHLYSDDMLMVAGTDKLLGRMTHIWVMGLYRWMELHGRGGTESLISPTSTPVVTWAGRVETPLP